ncbi:MULTISPECIES: efflux RND transporter periplasmic adaptor subunit [unclassified Duganella]|uniref:efflux RND transporter periplasmic adaptor subunit n=1 Tax=unclassified Duganella TaxID=2636909 RepID=UPI000E344AD6|nr:MULTISPECIES: efflux RND transporter periplasmic adaptor subunit [unclassified Duganella]RFP16206.1 efflux RND transporter periplasmic adaptor subunit [Duganella sp. BJB475]RFP32632.1 efflux RND transporter periplasmic adaptor subunit [Duganella sp. BJB476]
MKKPTLKQAGLAAAVAAALLALAGGWLYSTRAPADKKPAHAIQPALTVTATRPETADWPQGLSANGSISAWQETIVGAEVGGLRLEEVKVNVGDVVHRGQLLARFADDSVRADLAQQQAQLEEASAAQAEAKGNADRARTLANSGALSAQQTAQYMTAERSTAARVQLAQARLLQEQIRLRHTQIVATDEGVISSRSATAGGVIGQGQEMFRLIRDNRLEWRAEVGSAELRRIRPGQPVRLRLASGATLDGKVRIAAPTVDAATRNAMVYVDLPGGGEARAGMFATGQFELGHAQALTLPQSAVVMRDGYSYVYRIAGGGKVVQTRVTLGRRVGARVEAVDGIQAGMTVVEGGADFLGDGDTVRVVVAATSGRAVAAKPGAALLVQAEAAR